MDWSELGYRLSDGFSAAIEGLNRFLLKLFGNSNERAVKRITPNIERINSYESRLSELSDSDLKDQTRKFRARLADGETLDDILPEAFASCREAGKRFLKMRHYDVQMLGGMVLHRGMIAEMVTGEGKTLVATLPAYLNAIEAKGVHVVTVNDYLARRDAEWMSPLYLALGLSVGAIQSNMDSNVRQHHYGCDITYGTNNEFGFDYLRDNMKPRKELQCQRQLRYAIIDEVDSILIDEARTPLIISGQANDDPTKYARAHRVAMQLKRDLHFEVKEKEHTCHLTDAGVLEAERLVGVESFYTTGNMEWPHLIDNALKALHLYRRDKEYMVRTGEVIIIDEHTGRAMEGRQWSDGLHQAVEAKEGVRIKEETQTLATITFQNFFKLYDKISGMTGTAMTEANEFYKIYKLDVVAIPTNRTLIRTNYPDVIFCTEKEKWRAVVDEVKLIHKTGRPVLVGTTSVEKSEYLSEMFRRAGLKHEVLNAKFVEREAEIIAQAGRLDAITISTNMAGRGTDIILGGNPETQAWAELKHKYPTRLEVPPEVWRAAVEPYDEPMKKEGRIVAQPVSTVELCRRAGINDAERYAAVVDGANKYQLENPEKLAQNNGLDPETMGDIIQLFKSAHPGGLHIVGTERHESRRIDNQLRGRAGRQGDPGSSRFFLSLEDDLMRIFAGDWVKGILQRLGMQEGESIESRMVSRRVEGAQKKVEERNFEIRKNLLEYDEIMDTQRKRVYGYRQRILDGASCKELVLEMIDSQIDQATENFINSDYGPMSFAAWAGPRLGVEFEPKAFTRCSFSDADRLAREEALRQAEGVIIDAIDENLPEEEEEQLWNWEALSNTFAARWGIKAKPFDLKRIPRGELGAYFSREVQKAIEKVDLDPGADFFKEDFGVVSLLGWAKQKLTLDIDPKLVPRAGEEPSAVVDFIKDQVRQLYAKKEVEFPVHCGLSIYLPDRSAGNAGVYDRETLVAWANGRFGAHLELENVRTMMRSQVQEMLLGLSRDYYRSGQFFGDIEAKLDESLNGKETANPQEVGVLAEWCREKYKSPFEHNGEPMDREHLRWAMLQVAEQLYRPEIRELERVLLLQFLDVGWKDHLYAMDHLRSGVGLVGYAQIDPKVEYKRKGKLIFEQMWQSLENKVTDLIFRMEDVDTNFFRSVWNITEVQHEEFAPPPDSAGGDIREQQEDAVASSQKGDRKIEPIRNFNTKVGRNDPCPCGSGKKYKQCCLHKGGGRPTKPVKR